MENTNGLIRGILLEGDGEAGRAFRLINDRPRKALSYRTANEVYREGLLHSV